MLELLLSSILEYRSFWEGCFIENGAIYIFQIESFEKNTSRCKEPCTFFEMNKKTKIEVDNEEDLYLIESLLKEQTAD